MGSHFFRMLLFISCALALKLCLQEKRFVKYYKIRTCYKSTVSVIAWKNFATVDECMKFARLRNGLAFNFSPPYLNLSQQGRRYRNCQVLGCPETNNSATFAFDPFYDYYSAYGDFNSTNSATCIKSVGLFEVVQVKHNYTDAVDHCQSLGADLADVLGESRTNTLASLLKSLKGFYKGAYVGLDDIETEGSFENPNGDLLRCTKYRAWSVGHPRPNRKKEDCVILDSQRVWRAINCKIKMESICEFYPSPPDNPLVELTDTDCTKIKNKEKKQQCLSNQELYEVYKSSSRIDQCALMNDFDY